MSQASHFFTPLIFALSVIAIVYTSRVAFRQTDMKKLIAYSSVAHMGFVTMGIFSGNAVGEQGALFQMLSHGVISSALFLCVGVIYDRMHTREIAFYGGLVSRLSNGRESCRERVCQYVLISVVAVYLKQKKIIDEKLSLVN